MNTLQRCKRRTEGGGLRVEQPATEESLHHSHPHVLFFTQPVQLRSLRIDSRIIRTFIALKHGIQILGGRSHVKSRVNGKQDHLDKPCPDCLHRNPGVMGGKTDVPDDPLLMELMHISDIL